jgi:hypothetical protein
MRILAVESDLKPIPAGARDGILRREAAAAWRLQQDDVIREIYMAGSGTKAVLMLECADLASARRGRIYGFRTLRARALPGLLPALRARGRRSMIRPLRP